MTLTPDLDPELAAALAESPVDIGATLGGLSDDTVGAVRELFAAFPPPELSDRVTRTDHEIPGTDGVQVRVHRPVDADGALPCVYWMHGGGLVLGSYEMEDFRFDQWCQQFNCVGVSVDYRLAPEHPYPAPLDDCLAGLRWVVDHADDLGVDTGRIGIGGGSAGGGLAAGLALRVRDETDIALAFQMLIYPMIDDRQTTVSSQWPEKIWPPDANTYGWTSYLGDAKGGADVSPYAAAARATDVSGLPPTFIMVGAADGFVDEDVEYATRLRHAGIDVELHVYAGACHGFETLLPTAGVSARSWRDAGEWLAGRL